MVAELLKTKINKLKDILLAYKKVIVAYSGGTDSSFLLKCCSDFLGKNVLAVTAVSPTYTKKELNLAKEIARLLGVRHKIIKTDEMGDARFNSNPKNRCYYCKQELFYKLRSMARRQHTSFVLDGSNLDDLRDYRPGAKAKRDLGVRSPLAEAKFTKGDIRKLSREFGLKTWNQPAGACLASRFAYGQKITMSGLGKIEKAEKYLCFLGIEMARLRHYELSDKTLLARIEVNKKDIKRVVTGQLSIVRYLKRLGYNYITLDLEGYRMGSMNEGLK